MAMHRNACDRSTGYVAAQGEFLAMTLVESRWFKTERGAIKWLSARGYAPDGRRLDA